MPVVADAPHVLGIEQGRIEQAQERALRVDARDDGAGRDLLAAASTTPVTRAVLRRDRADLGARCGSRAPSVRAAAARALRERAEAALHEHRRAGAVAAGGRGLQQQVARSCPPTTGRRRRPWMPRAAITARSSVGLEPLGREVGDRHRAPAQQALAVRRGRGRGSRGRGRGSGQRVARSCGSVDVGRRHRRARGARTRGDAREASRGTRDSARASFAEKRPSSAGASSPGSPQRRSAAAVGQRARRRAARPRRAGAATAEVSSSTSEARKGPAVWATVETLKPGWNSSVTAAPPDDGAPLEDEGLQAALGQEGRGDEAVVAAADDDDVGLHAHLPPVPVLQDLEGGDAAGRAHDAAARDAWRSRTCRGCCTGVR